MCSVQVEDKETNIDTVKIVTKVEDKPTKVKTHVEFLV